MLHGPFSLSRNCNFVEFGVAVELNAKAERNKSFLIESLGREHIGHQYAHEQSQGTC
jgi:hypothetical protein